MLEEAKKNKKSLRPMVTLFLKCFDLFLGVTVKFDLCYQWYGRRPWGVGGWEGGAVMRCGLERLMQNGVIRGFFNVLSRKATGRWTKLFELNFTVRKTCPHSSSVFPVLGT